ncbi:hypothetical protein Z046_30850 [Pseudomonas aeruginosa VRFPA09]|nr:hypothetical protein Z046_30850 [Pseudomonas aeruginosa VRFPA09]
MNRYLFIKRQFLKLFKRKQHAAFHRALNYLVARWPVAKGGMKLVFTYLDQVSHQPSLRYRARIPVEANQLGVMQNRGYPHSLQAGYAVVIFRFPDPLPLSRLGLLDQVEQMHSKPIGFADSIQSQCGQTNGTRRAKSFLGTLPLTQPNGCQGFNGKGNARLAIWRGDFDPSILVNRRRLPERHLEKGVDPDMCFRFLQQEGQFLE